jgi:hypothetical protein
VVPVRRKTNGTKRTGKHLDMRALERRDAADR